MDRGQGSNVIPVLIMRGTLVKDKMRW